MVASMLRAQRRDPAKAQAKCAFATNYPLANRQLRSPLILRYRMQRDKPFFLFGGFGLEWLYWSYLSPMLKWVELSKPKTYGGVLKAAPLRAALLFGSIAVFAFGSIGLFVGFEWSAFIDDIVLSLLAGIIVMRFVIMVAVFVLAPRWMI